MFKLNGGNYPTTEQGLESLAVEPTSDPLPRRWVQIMSKVPTDPWGSAYIYRFPGRKNPSEPEIISRGPDGLEGNADDLSSEDEQTATGS